MSTINLKLCDILRKVINLREENATIWLKCKILIIITLLSISANSQIKQGRLGKNEQKKSTTSKPNKIYRFNGQILYGWCNADIKIRELNPKTDNTTYGTLNGKRYKLTTVQRNSDGDADGFIIEYDDNGYAYEYFYNDAHQGDSRYHLQLNKLTKKPLIIQNRNKDGSEIGMQEFHLDDFCYRAMRRDYYDMSGNLDSTNRFDCNGNIEQ